MIAKLFRYIHRVLAPVPTDAGMQQVAEELKAAAPFLASRSHCDVNLRASTVAFQVTRDPFYFALFGAIALEFKIQAGANVVGVVTDRANRAIGNSPLRKLMRTRIFSFFFDRQQQNIWAAAIGAPATAYLQNNSCIDTAEAYGTWKSFFDDSVGFDALTINEILVGDLIIDTYLRFKPAARFDATDKFVLYLLKHATHAIENANAFFEVYKPQAYFTSYTTYINHGVMTRVALKKKVNVYSFGNLIQTPRKIIAGDFYHSVSSCRYRQIADAMTDEEEAAAKKLIEARLAGKIGGDMYYMLTSAYANTSDSFPEPSLPKKSSVVVFLHDFFDSPHVYADFIFPDFFSWAEYTIQELLQVGFEVLVKPHPNGRDGNAPVLACLRAQFPQATFISEKITNLQLKASGMCAGVTAYGSVAPELAYLGVPSVACAKHPYWEFDFCRTAKTVAEYKSFLESADLSVLDEKDMRRQALGYVHAHHLCDETGYRDVAKTIQDLYYNCSSEAPNFSAISGVIKSQSWHKLTSSLINSATEGGP